MKFYIPVLYQINPFMDEIINFSVTAKNYNEAKAAVEQELLLRGIKIYRIKKTKASEDATRLGQLGGKSTLKKYGKEEMTQWGKKGGRPKKIDIK